VNGSLSHDRAPILHGPFGKVFGGGGNPVVTRCASLGGGANWFGVLTVFAP
jgi:hypothetical protein